VGVLQAAQEAEREWVHQAKDDANWVDGWMRLTDLVWRRAPAAGCSSISRLVLALASQHFATHQQTAKTTRQAALLCTACQGRKAETAQHIVFECPAHDQARRTHLDRLRGSLPADEKNEAADETAIGRQARQALQATVATTAVDKLKLGQPVVAADSTKRLWTTLRGTKLRLGIALFIMSNLLRYGNDKTTDEIGASFRSFERALAFQTSDPASLPSAAMTQLRLTPVAAAKLVHIFSLTAEYADHPLQFWPTAAPRHGVLQYHDEALRKHLHEHAGLSSGDCVKANLRDDPCLVHPIWDPTRQAELIALADKFISDGLNSRIIIIAATGSPAVARALRSARNGVAIAITLEVITVAADRADASAGHTRKFTLLWLDAAHQSAATQETHQQQLKAWQSDLVNQAASAAITTRRWFRETPLANWLRLAFDCSEPDSHDIRLPRNLLRLAAGAASGAEQAALQRALQDDAFQTADLSFDLLQHVDRCWKQRQAATRLSNPPAPAPD
jgi:hypothetical protein